MKEGNEGDEIKEGRIARIALDYNSFVQFSSFPLVQEGLCGG